MAPWLTAASTVGPRLGTLGWLPWHPQGTRPMKTAHGPPCWGEIHSREARRGGEWLVEPWRSPCSASSPGLASRESWENAAFPESCSYSRSSVPILPILTSHIVDSFLPIACCRLQSSILLKIRPPEELLHRTCRAFRGESDSSTLEVSGGLLVVVFEASRQTVKSAA